MENNSFLEQLRNSLPLLLKIFLPISFIFIGIAWYCLHSELQVGFLTRDPSQILDTNPFVGIISNLGVILWSASTMICFFMAIVFSILHDKKDLRRFLFWTGSLSLLFLLDDLFLIHDYIFPRYFHLDELYLYFVYVLIIGVIFWRFGKLIFKSSDYLFFLLSFSLFGLSVLIDIVSHFYPMRASILFEDGFKFMGITAWLVYFSKLSLQLLGHLSVCKVQDMNCQKGIFNES